MISDLFVINAIYFTVKQISFTSDNIYKLMLVILVNYSLWGKFNIFWVDKMSRERVIANTIFVTQFIV